MTGLTDMTDDDFKTLFSHSATIQASHCAMSVSYHVLAPRSCDFGDDVCFIGMLTRDGIYVDVPCTYIAAEMIQLYETGTLLTLYISPRVFEACPDGARLVPLCIGACRADGV